MEKTLTERVLDLAGAVGVKMKGVWLLINDAQDDLSALETTEKSNLVAAINELNSRIAALEGPPDLTPGFAASPTRTPIACEMI